MARTVTEIYNELLLEHASRVELESLDSESTSAIYRLWLMIVAITVHAHEKLFDAHKAEVTALIEAQRVHTKQWYITMAKAFQYGDALLTDSDTYAVINQDNMVVDEAAAVEVGSVLRIKVAKKTAGALGPLTSDERAALAIYMDRVKDAGVHLSITTQAGDTLKLIVEISYDALILNSNGERIDGTADRPVLDAVKAYLLSLPFNGLLVLNRLIRAVENVEGVVICKVILAQSLYGGGGYTTFTKEVLPDAGYLTLNEEIFNDNITYVAHEPL
jgi:hypothetical protein